MLFRKEPLVQLKSIVTFAVPNGKRPIGKLNLPKRVKLTESIGKRQSLFTMFVSWGLEKEIS
jgi:hypothetical protein